MHDILVCLWLIQLFGHKRFILYLFFTFPSAYFPNSSSKDTQSTASVSTHVRSTFWQGKGATLSKSNTEKKHFKGLDGGRWSCRALPNLEYGRDVRVRPESRLREMETHVKTQRMDNKNITHACTLGSAHRNPTCRI